MYREKIIATALWLEDCEKTACALVYSCLDASPAIVNAVLAEICAPAENLWRIILKGM